MHASILIHHHIAELDGESFLFWYEEVLPLSINTRQVDAKGHGKMSIKLIINEKYEY